MISAFGVEHTISKSAYNVSAMTATTKSVKQIHKEHIAAGKRLLDSCPKCKIRSNVIGRL